jgi:uncharacterized Ntn-hydrolase superfamily protein
MMTFSIVARDPQTGELGVAVQSKFVAIGSLTPWAKAGAGAIATQAWINTIYGTRGLELLASGLSPKEIIAQLTREDEGRSHRQVGMIGVWGILTVAHNRELCYTGANKDRCSSQE